MTFDTTEDRLLGGRILFRQPASGYRAAIDPVFLAASVPARPRMTVLDLGCGAGAAALCLLARLSDAHVTGVEKSPDIANLARENATANGWDARFEVRTGDIRDIRGGGADLVIVNPPYYANGSYSASPNSLKTAAHADQDDCSLADWVAAAARNLKPKGGVHFILPAARLVELGTALAAAKFGGVRIIPLWPKIGTPASRVLVAAVKDSKAPDQLHPGLYLHDADGGYTAAANAILKDGLGLDTETA
jgi:tRNA1(Val) A37 N6-methylase TrmN6